MSKNSTSFTSSENAIATINKIQYSDNSQKQFQLVPKPRKKKLKSKSQRDQSFIKGSQSRLQIVKQDLDSLVKGNQPRYQTVEDKSFFQSEVDLSFLEKKRKVLKRKQELLNRSILNSNPKGTSSTFTKLVSNKSPSVEKHTSSLPSRDNLSEKTHFSNKCKSDTQGFAKHHNSKDKEAGSKTFYHIYFNDTIHTNVAHDKITEENDIYSQREGENGFNRETKCAEGSQTNSRIPSNTQREFDKNDEKTRCSFPETDQKNQHQSRSHSRQTFYNTQNESQHPHINENRHQNENKHNARQENHKFKEFIINVVFCKSCFSFGFYSLLTLLVVISTYSVYKLPELLTPEKPNYQTHVHHYHYNHTRHKDQNPDIRKFKHMLNEYNRLTHQNIKIAYNKVIGKNVENEFQRLTHLDYRKASNLLGRVDHRSNEHTKTKPKTRKKEIPQNFATPIFSRDSIKTTLKKTRTTAPQKNKTTTITVPNPTSRTTTTPDKTTTTTTTTTTLTTTTPTPKTTTTTTAILPIITITTKPTLTTESPLLVPHSSNNIKPIINNVVPVPVWTGSNWIWTLDYSGNENFKRENIPTTDIPQTMTLSLSPPNLNYESTLASEIGNLSPSSDNSLSIDPYRRADEMSQLEELDQLGRHNIQLPKQQHELENGYNDLNVLQQHTINTEQKNYDGNEEFDKRYPLPTTVHDDIPEPVHDDYIDNSMKGNIRFLPVIHDNFDAEKRTFKQGWHQRKHRRQHKHKRHNHKRRKHHRRHRNKRRHIQKHKHITSITTTRQTQTTTSPTTMTTPFKDVLVTHKATSAYRQPFENPPKKHMNSAALSKVFDQFNTDTDIQNDNKNVDSKTTYSPKSRHASYFYSTFSPKSTRNTHIVLQKQLVGHPSDELIDHKFPDNIEITVENDENTLRPTQYRERTEKKYSHSRTPKPTDQYPVMYSGDPDRYSSMYDNLFRKTSMHDHNDVVEITDGNPLHRTYQKEDTEDYIDPVRTSHHLNNPTSRSLYEPSRSRPRERFGPPYDILRRMSYYIPKRQSTTKSSYSTPIFGENISKRARHHIFNKKIKPNDMEQASHMVKETKPKKGRSKHKMTYLQLIKKLRKDLLSKKLKKKHEIETKKRNEAKQARLKLLQELRQRLHALRERENEHNRKKTITEHSVENNRKSHCKTFRTLKAGKVMRITSKQSQNKYLIYNLEICHKPIKSNHMCKTIKLKTKPDFELLVNKQHIHGQVMYSLIHCKRHVSTDQDATKRMDIEKGDETDTDSDWMEKKPGDKEMDDSDVIQIEDIPSRKHKDTPIHHRTVISKDQRRKKQKQFKNPTKSHAEEKHHVHGHNDSKLGKKVKAKLSTRHKQKPTIRNNQIGNLVKMIKDMKNEMKKASIQKFSEKDIIQKVQKMISRNSNKLKQYKHQKYQKGKNHSKKKKPKKHNTVKTKKKKLRHHTEHNYQEEETEDTNDSTNRQETPTKSGLVPFRLPNQNRLNPLMDDVANEMERIANNPTTAATPSNPTRNQNDEMRFNGEDNRNVNRYAQRDALENQENQFGLKRVETTDHNLRPDDSNFDSSLLKKRDFDNKYKNYGDDMKSTNFDKVNLNDVKTYDKQIGDPLQESRDYYRDKTSQLDNFHSQPYNEKYSYRTDYVHALTTIIPPTQIHRYRSHADISEPKRHFYPSELTEEPEEVVEQKPFFQGSDIARPRQTHLDRVNKGLNQDSNSNDRPSEKIQFHRYHESSEPFDNRDGDELNNGNFIIARHPLKYYHHAIDDTSQDDENAEVGRHRMPNRHLDHHHHHRHNHYHNFVDDRADRRSLFPNAEKEMLESQETSDENSNGADDESTSRQNKHHKHKRHKHKQKSKTDGMDDTLAAESNSGSHKKKHHIPDNYYDDDKRNDDDEGSSDGETIHKSYKHHQNHHKSHHHNRHHIKKYHPHHHENDDDDNVSGEKMYGTLHNHHKKKHKKKQTDGENTADSSGDEEDFNMQSIPTKKSHHKIKNIISKKSLIPTPNIKDSVRAKPGYRHRGKARGGFGDIGAETLKTDDLEPLKTDNLESVIEKIVPAVIKSVHRETDNNNDRSSFPSMRPTTITKLQKHRTTVRPMTIPRKTQHHTTVRHTTHPTHKTTPRRTVPKRTIHPTHTVIPKPKTQPNLNFILQGLKALGLTPNVKKREKRTPTRIPPTPITHIRTKPKPLKPTPKIIATSTLPQPQVVPLHDSKKLHILCFGDSLTAGYNQHGKNFFPYCTRLQQILNYRSNIPVYAEAKGVVGEMAHKQMTNRLPLILGNATFQYDWVIILGGTNDILHVKNFADDQEFLNQLETVWQPRITKDIEKLHQTALSRGAHTMLLTVPENSIEAWPDYKPLLKMRQRINEALRKYANMSHGKTVLCDVARKIPRHTLGPAAESRFWDDHLHMTPEGYSKMAGIVADCLRPYLPHPNGW